MWRLRLEAFIECYCRDRLYCVLFQLSYIYIDKLHYDFKTNSLFFIIFIYICMLFSSPKKTNQAREDCEDRKKSTNIKAEETIFKKQQATSNKQHT